jgi:hypothetical protein
MLTESGGLKAAPLFLFTLPYPEYFRIAFLLSSYQQK